MHKRGAAMTPLGGDVGGAQAKLSASNKKTTNVGVSDFGYRVSGFGFWVSDFGYRVSGFGFWVSDFGFLPAGKTWGAPGGVRVVIVVRRKTRPALGCGVCGLRFGIGGLGWGVGGLGFRVWGLGCGVWGVGCRE